MAQNWQSVGVVLTMAVAANVGWADDRPAAVPTADPGQGILTLRADPPTDAAPAPLTLDQQVDRIKNPFAGFTWGADQRVRNEYFNPAISLNDKSKGHEYEFLRYRSRIWGSYSPTEFLEFNGRLGWEGRHYWQPSTKPEWDNGYGFVDTLNVKLKSKDLGLTLTVGRQDIMLGDGWLVLEGTPLDGSTSTYFDAARLTWDVPSIKTTFDGIFINQYSDPDHWLPTINDADRNQIEQDERGAIFYVSNKSIKDTTIEPYFIYKHDRKVLANGDNGDIYTFGGRVEHTFDSHWKGRVEGAGQFGEKNNQSLAAWGVLSRLTYSFNDPWDNKLKANFETLSGDNPGTKGTNEQFDMLWGRWPQWSELYIYTVVPETRVAETTNLMRMGPGWQCSPTKKWGIFVDYNLLLAPESPLDGKPGYGSGAFRGQLWSVVTKYKFNRFLSGHIWTEFFQPGDYYSTARSDSAVYLRAELVFTF